MTIVDLTQFFPFTFIMHLTRALVVFNICHTILKNKYNTLVTFFSIIVPWVKPDRDKNRYVSAGA